MSSNKSHDKQLYNNSSADYIPIAFHYNENTLITKNGELLQTIQINGINSEKISNDLFNLRTTVRQSVSGSKGSEKYAFWIHTIRRKADLDDPTEYPNFLSANIHDIWRRKNYWHDKFVNALYITVVHDAPAMKFKNFNSLVNSLSSKTIANFQEKFLEKAASDLTQNVDSLLEGLSEFGAQRLGIKVKGKDCYSDMMFLYRRIIQLNEDDCLLPIADLSEALASNQYTVGSDKIEVIGDGGKKFAALISIKEYQEVSSDALDSFLQIPVEMVATEVFYFVNKEEVRSVYENQNYILSVSRDEELRKMKGLDKIFDDQIEADRFCYQQISFMVIGDNIKMLDKQVNQASDTLSRIGIVHVREDINLEKTFWAQLPGNFSYLTRLKPTIVDNTAAMASLHNFPTGHQFNPWGRAVTILRTERGTPYFMNFHDKAGLATTCIFGEKKTGRTTLLNFLLSEADKYRPSTIYITNDMDAGLYVKARGGRWFQREKNIINPLNCGDTPHNRQYLLEFFKIIAKHYFDPLSPKEIEGLKLLCNSVFQTSLNMRKLSTIIKEVTDATLITRLAAYAEGGAYYEVFEQENTLEYIQEQVTAINLISFNDDDYIKKYFPKEKKLVEQFEYDLNSMKAVKAAVILAAQNMMQDLGSGPKILAIDNFAEMIDLKYYQHLVTYINEKTIVNNGVPIFVVNTNKLELLHKSNVPQPWVRNIATSFIFPSDISVIGFDKILDLEGIELKKLSFMNIPSRMFLIKQDKKTIAAELSIGGLPALVKTLCSGEKERAIYKDVVAKHGNNKPEDWVEAFYLAIENNT